ncbi:MAG: TolC family protein [Rhodospirillales bacterium]
MAQVFPIHVAPGGKQVAALALPLQKKPQAQPAALRTVKTAAPVTARSAKVMRTAGVEHAFLLDQFKKGLNRALDLSHDIQSAKYQLTAARHALTATQNSKYNPELSLEGVAGAGFGLKDDNSNTINGFSEKASTALKVSMALLDGGKQKAEFDLASIGIRKSNLSIKQARTRILSTVRQSFWRWQLAEAHKRTINKWRRPFKQWLRSAHKLFAEQLITAKDLLAGESVDSSFDEQLESLDQSIKVHHVIWKTLTGGSPLKTTNALWPELPAMPSSKVFENGLDSSLLVAQAKTAIETQTHNMQLIEADSKTKLGLETSGQKIHPGDSSLFFGVRFKVPLYDRGVTDSRLRESRAKMAAALKNLDAVRQDVRLQLIRLSSELELSKGINHRQSAALSASLAKLQNVKTLYEKLPGKLPDLFQALGGYLSAVQQSSSAMNSYLTTYNVFLKTVGAETVAHEEI